MESLPGARQRPAPSFTAVREDGTPLALRDFWFRKDLLLVLLHGAGCPHCRRAGEALAAHRETWESWGYATLILHSEPEGALPLAAAQARDPGGAARAAFAPGADLVLAVIERRGRLMEGWSLRHPEPVDWREVAETVRWASVQEPECGACEVLPGWDDGDGG